jgi:hypothetical protein
VAGVNPLRPDVQQQTAKLPTYKGKSPAALVAGPVDVFVPPPPTETVKTASAPEKPAKAGGKGKKASGKAAAAAKEAGKTGDRQFECVGSELRFLDLDCYLTLKGATESS